MPGAYRAAVCLCPTHATARPSHLGLCVADLERSLRFYCDGLGFTQAEGYDLDEKMLVGIDRALEVSSPVKLRSQMITNGELKIELLHFAEPSRDGCAVADRGARSASRTCRSSSTTSTRSPRELATLGGTVLTTTRAQLGYEVVFVADPDGARVELMAPPAN